MSEASSATILGGIAAIISAVAWPATALFLCLTQKEKISRLVEILIAKLSKADRVKWGSFEIENEIKETLAAVTALPSPDAHETQVPPDQLEVAKKFDRKVEALETDESAAVDAIRSSLRDLAKEYEWTRSQMEPGHPRTMAMNRIVAKMRAIAGKAGPLLPQFTVAQSEGLRLAAIAILQVKADVTFSRWLGERVAVETPFIFYQASVALLQMASDNVLKTSPQVKLAVDGALQTLRRFDGPPDKNTVSVLTAAQEQLRT